MENIAASIPESQTEAESQAVIAHLFAEMYRLNEVMRQDQIEIDRIKAETTRLKIETRATLDRLGTLI